MGDMTKNFSKWEWECGCGCGFDTLADETIEFVQKVRDKVGEPLRITSGCRCPTYNAHPDVGGAPNSLHLPDKNGAGRAVDIQFSTPNRKIWHVRSRERRVAHLYIACDQLGAKGLGIYAWGVHMDMRLGHKRRWEDSSWNPKNL